MEEYVDIQFPEEKKIRTVIDGEEYVFKAVFSLRDYEIVIGDLEEENCQYRNIIAKVVMNHICEGDAGKLTISALPDEILHNYIDEVVKDSKRIRTIYEEKNDASDIYERFVISVKDNLNTEIGTIKDSLANIKLPQINILKWYFQQLPALTIPKEIFNIKPIIPDMSILTESLSQIAQSVINTQEMARSIAESFQPIIEMQQSFVAQIAKQAAQVLSQLPSLSYSEERIEEMRKALCKWGEYGWTLPGHAKLSDFLIEPSDAKEANSIASKYCTKAYMHNLFEKSKEFASVKKSDFSEAVDDYNDKRYKSCACILFSLIDARLIRMQTEKEQGKLVRRKVGKGAVEKSRDKILNDSDIENTFFNILRFENVYTCLAKFFEDGKNFVEQPEVMNRNFLVHGMLTRRVSKRDCDQLFLLYHNWLSILEKY